MLQTLSRERAGAADPLPAAIDTGLLGVCQLKRAWARQLARREGRLGADPRDFRRDHLVFDAQLFGTADLWVSTDRVGFNPPERAGWRFQGPHLHWDVSLHQPMPLAMHGILYLTDTAADQGAFTLVPGFHRRVGDWLAQLPPGADPRKQDLYALGPTSIAGRAGDLVIWHDALPHGASPNRGRVPRIVQYIRMYPTRQDVSDVWL